MKRYICQFVRGGFPELYAVLDTHEGWQVSEPKPYHDANDEAEARNNGTWGFAEATITGEQFQGLASWCAGLNLSTQP